MYDPVATLIVVAQNAEGSIAETLRVATGGAQPDEFQVIVVCHGCHDRTAEAARAAAPWAQVLETPVAGRNRAITLAMARAFAEVLVVIEAGVSVPTEGLRALIAPLREGRVQVAWGRPTGQGLLGAVLRMAERMTLSAPLYALSDRGVARAFPLRAKRNVVFAPWEQLRVRDCAYEVTASTALRLRMASSSDEGGFWGRDLALAAERERPARPMFHHVARVAGAMAFGVHGSRAA